MNAPALPKGFELTKNTPPALPQGFVVNGTDTQKDEEKPEPTSLGEREGGATGASVTADFLAEAVPFGLGGKIQELFGKNDLGKISPEKQQAWIEKEDARSAKRLNAVQSAYDKANVPLDQWVRENHSATLDLSTTSDRFISMMAKRRSKALEFHAKELQSVQDRRNNILDVKAGVKKAAEYSAVKAGGAAALKSFGDAFGEALPKAAGAVQATVTGQNPEDTKAYKAGQAFADFTEGSLAIDPARADETGQQVAQGLGQAASMLVPGAGLKAAGAGRKVTGATMAASGAAQNAVGGLEDAKAFEADRGEQLKSFYLNAGIGLSEALPLNRLLGRLNSASGGKVARVLKNTTAQGIEEAIQEVGQTVGGNVVASEIAKYDEGRALMDGAGEAGKIGGLIGALLGGAGSAITSNQAQQQSDTQNEAPALPEGFEPDQQGEPTNETLEPAEKVRAKVFKKATAYDAAGGQTRVEYAIIDADSLITSHTDDLKPNPIYPQALQPRDRSRKSSETQVADIAAKLNPEQMGETPDAGSGAPIISANGIVESGNGRSLALRRVYQEGGEKALEYRKWLKSQRYPIRGIKKPVLVRIADTGRSDQERVEFTRRANAATTADMSVTERGIADARSLTPDDFNLAEQGGAETLSNIPFVRRVLTKVTTEAERGKLIDSKGHLSVDGKRRVEAAVAAYAYEDPRVVSSLLETTDKTLRSIGNVMIDVAPSWAQLRAEVESGSVDERVNIIPNIIEAATIVTEARHAGATLEERTELIKSDMFNESGEINPITQDVLKMFYDEGSTKQRSDKLIAEDLKYYAQEAMKVLSGPDIFGDRSADQPAQRILKAIRDRRANIKQTTKDDDFTAAEPQEQVFEPEAKAEAATDVDPDVIERDDKTGEMFDMAPATDSKAFKKWAGTNSDVIESDEINDFDFKGAGPFVVKAYHGTTHDFEAFDASITGNKEGQFGAVNYFTSSEGDATDNYGKDGPDLTQRIELRAERLIDEADGDDAKVRSMAHARQLAREEIAGNENQTLEVYIRTEKPFVVGDGSPFLELIDFDDLEKRAIEFVADDQGVSVSEVRDDPDEYESLIDEARWDIESETENPLAAAIETVASNYDFEAADLMAAVAEYSEGANHQTLEEIMRKSESLMYAEDYDDGGMVGHHILGQIIKELGFDSIILKDANKRFSMMNMEYGTTHIHVFDENNSNIKSVNNRGTFDANDPRILYDKGPSSAALPEGFELDSAPLRDDVGSQPEAGKPKPKQTTRGEQKRLASATPDGEKIGSAHGKAIGLHKITTAIYKRLDVLARQGRMGNLPKKVRGFYRPNSGVIRTRQSYMGEINTFVHEAGHHFEFTQDKDFRRLLERFDQELIPMDYEKGRKNKKLAISEGFAEYFKAYLTNPSYAEKNAPKFTEAFSAYLDQTDKGLNADIAKFSQQYNDWLTAPSATSVASNIVPHESQKGTFTRAEDQSRKEFAGQLINQGIENFVDRLNPMKLAVKRLEQIYRDNKGRPLNLKASEDPYKILRLAENASSKGVMDMFDGVANYQSVDHEGASLQDAILTAVGNKSKWTQENVTDFDAYLVARRAVQEYARYHKGEIKNAPTINSLADHKQAIKDFEKSNPQFKRAAEQVYEYTQNLWKKKFDAGLIDPETYALTTARQDYVPFRRDMSDKASSAKFAAGFKDSGKHSGGSHHFDGSNRPILSPLQSIMEDSITSATVIARNDALKSLVSMAKKAGRGGAAIVEVIPNKEIKGENVDAIQAVKNRLKDSTMSVEDQELLVSELSDMWDGDGMTTVFKNVDTNENGENILYVWENGKRQALLVHSPDLAADVYGMMLGLNDEAQSALVNILSVPTTVLRMGITNHPMFIATNFTRDQLSTWVQSDAGFMPFVDGFKGIVSEITNDKYARTYNTIGGVSGGVNVSAFKKGVIEKDLNRLRARGIQVRRLWRLSELAKLGDISESATRLGAYARYVKKYKKQGLSDYDAFFEAAYEATDIMDFSMHGAKAGHARRLIPFLNAQVIGLYKSGRVLAPGGLFKTIKPYIKYRMGDATQNISADEKRNIERGAKAWAKVGMIGLIGLSLSALHDDDPEYLEFSEYYRATHWVTKMGDEWVLIPKPFELAAMSNLFERSYEAFKLKDKSAFKKFRKGIAEMLTPPMNIPAIAIPIEQKLNKTFFFGSSILPYGSESYQPYAQFGVSTSIMSRKLGNLLNWSPARIDHAIKGLGGTTGRDILRVTDAMSGDKPSLTTANTPVISRLVKNPNYSAVSRTKTFDLVGDNGGKWQGLSGQIKKAMKRGDEAEARKAASFIETEDERLYVLSNALLGSSAAEVALKRSHPMRRAKDASELLRGARKEVEQFGTYGDVKLTRDQRRDLSTGLAALDAAMSRNGLKYSNVKGFGQKKHSPEQPIIDDIKKASPQFHKALTTSKAWKKVGNEGGIDKRYAILKRKITPQYFDRQIQKMKSDD